MLKNIIIPCRQIELTDLKSPLIPPNKFKYDDSDIDIYVEKIDEARMLYKTYSKLKSNMFSHRRYVNGALYTKIYNSSANVIFPKENQMIELHVKYSDDNQTSILSIYKEADNNHQYLKKLHSLSIATLQYKDNTCRSRLKDLGQMIVLGSGKKNSNTLSEYNIMKNNNDLKNIVSEVIHSGKKYYQQIGLSHVINEMEQLNKTKYGSTKNFIPSIVQSRDLINAGHFDTNDASESISTWTELDMNSANDWYFVLPNVTIDKEEGNRIRVTKGNIESSCVNSEKGTIIPLSHGVTIKWDGTKIFHCSTVGNLGDKNHVFGTFFGIRN